MFEYHHASLNVPVSEDVAGNRRVYKLFTLYFYYIYQLYQWQGTYSVYPAPLHSAWDICWSSVFFFTEMYVWQAELAFNTPDSTNRNVDKIQLQI